MKYFAFHQGIGYWVSDITNEFRNPTPHTLHPQVTERSAS